MGKPEVECAGAHESNAVRNRWSLITDRYSLPPWPPLLGAWAKPLRPQLRKGAWLRRSFTLSTLVSPRDVAKLYVLNSYFLLALSASSFLLLPCAFGAGL